jgi:hypothetical protein
MNTKKLLTGAAVLALGVTGSVASHLTFERQARAQSAQSNEPQNTAEPGTSTGTRGESGRAGPMRMPDAGAKAAEPEKGAEPEKKATEPEKGAAPEKATEPDKPKTLKSPEGDSDARDPIPPGPATASPTHRQSRPW